MNAISSGTSNERIIRSILFSLLVDFFAVYFLYDGYVGYPRKNVLQLASLLGLPASQAPAANQSLSEARGQELVASVRPGETLDKLSADIGAPPIRQQDAGYFPGPGGWLRVELERDRIREARWVKGPHTEADQRIQRWIGWGLVAFGFVATVNLARVIGTRAVLTGEGLRVSGSPLIPFESMTALRLPGTPSGIAQLEYTREGNRKTLPLDPYFYKQAAAIAREIAQHKGFS